MRAEGGITPAARGAPSSAGGDAASAVERHSPELPVDALRRILAPHAGDVATLCACACVARAWRDAARESALWVSLRLEFASQIGKANDAVPWVPPVTDERLAELVKRAGSGLNGAPHLTQLTVTGCELVSARGVAAALAGAGLHNKLTLLRIANTLCEEEDGDVVRDMPVFLRQDAPPDDALDVRGFTLCEEQVEHSGQYVQCARLCGGQEERTRCEKCDIPVCCDFCFQEAPLCEHTCEFCGALDANTGCVGCDDERESRLCADCTVQCYECGSPFCKFHARRHMARCSGCRDARFCEGCIDWQTCDRLLVRDCALCKRHWCGAACAQRSLKNASDWAAELQARAGGVDAAALARLHSWEAKDAEDEFCEHCAINGTPDEDDSSDGGS